MDKSIQVKKVGEGTELIALDDEIPEHKVMLECGKEDCKKRTVLHVKIPETVKGLRVEGMYPLCRDHLEEMYRDGFFDGIKDINQLKMIEGIIKYGSMEKWLEATK